MQRFNTTFRVQQNHFRRTGISLLEVMIAIFILSVGLLSVASLLPVGSFQVQKALSEDRKSHVGQNAFREFRTRGMANPALWIRADGTAYLAQTAPGMNVLPVAIDPYYLSSTILGGSGGAVFPRGGNLTSSMPRIGLSIASTPALAEMIMVARDDVIYERQADADLPPVGKFEGANLRRMSEGHFSWMATLAPANFAMRAVAPGVQFNLSLVVFYKRNISIANQEDGAGHERQLSVGSDLSGFGMGGGEIEVRGTAAETSPKKGEWIMLSCAVPLPAPQSGNGVYHRWYRVVTVGDYDSGGRALTLAGPDWGSNVAPTHASIFNGAVALYEKTLHIEGPSVWTN
ncbi:MAG: prepilin-type N-terminal cleavage/methylation domain-containing protein [Planctomycetota bacterium]|nr:prepilin-type N-terminal cleavage/methylation domain-containing protein [Planctomycetota bacterium]